MIITLRRQNKNPIKDRLRSSYRVTAKVVYRLFFGKELSTEQTVAEIHTEHKHIYIADGLSNSDTVKALIHELIHAIDLEHEMFVMEGKRYKKTKKDYLTERQVCALEQGLYHFLRLNKFL